MNHGQSEPKVSIILPLYRVKEWLPQAIASIKAQTYHAFECLCLDDGSPNEMADFARTLTQEDARFKVFEFTNAGVAATRNRGLDLAQGEFVAFIDQDDCYHPRFLECMVKTAEETTSNIVTCLYQLVDETFDVETACHAMPQQTAEVLPDPLRERMQNGWLRNVWVSLFRRSALNQLRFNPDLRGSDDSAFTCRAFATMGKAAFLKEPLYYYRKQPEAVTQKMPLSFLLACVNYAVDVYPVLCEKMPEIATKDFLKELSVALKQARKYSYTSEEKRIFITAVTEALKCCKVSPFAWSFGKQWSYWKFRLFLR